MTQLSWVPRLNITKTIGITPVITASSAYTAGFQLGGIMTLPNVVRQDPSGISAGVSELHSVTILDGSLQSAAIDIWFFNTSPTVTSVDFQAFAMTLASQQAQCLGAISVGTTYSAAAAVSTSTDGANIGKVLQVAGSAAVPTSLYAIAIARGTPTYSTTGALKFLFSFYID